MLKKIASVFLIQFLLLSAVLAYLGKGFANADAVSASANYSFWEAWTHTLELSIPSSFVAAVTFLLIHQTLGHSLSVGNLARVFLALATSVFFFVIYFFLVGSLSVFSVIGMAVISHLVSWGLLFGFVKMNELRGDTEERGSDKKRKKALSWAILFASLAFLVFTLARGCSKETEGRGYLSDQKENH